MSSWGGGDAEGEEGKGGGVMGGEEEREITGMLTCCLTIYITFDFDFNVG